MARNKLIISVLKLELDAISDKLSSPQQEHVKKIEKTNPSQVLRIHKEIRSEYRILINKECFEASKLLNNNKDKPPSAIIM